MNATTHFASGTNNPGEIEGFAAVGMNVGSSANAITADGRAALAALAGTGIRVFLDSGAFGEIRFGAVGPEVVRPITDADWNARLDLYLELAGALGDQLYAVAPDMVGNQEVTLDRLAKYADRIRAIRALGARILVPLQKGVLSLAECDEYVAAIIGDEDYIRAIPMKKDATSLDEVLELVRARSVSRLHLLGMGEKNPRFAATEAAILAAAPAIELYCDSVRIMALVGRSEGKPRPLTAAQDEVRAELLEAGIWADSIGDDEIDYTDEVGTPSAWITAAGKRLVADRLGLAGAERAAWMADPDAWAAANDNDWTWQAIDAAWQLWTVGQLEQGRLQGGEYSVNRRKRESIKKVFGTGTAANA